MPPPVFTHKSFLRTFPKRVKLTFGEAGPSGFAASAWRPAPSCRVKNFWGKVQLFLLFQHPESWTYLPKWFQLLLVFSISAQGIHCLIAGSTPVRLRHVSRLQQVWSRSRKIHELRLSQSRHQDWCISRTIHYPGAITWTTMSEESVRPEKSINKLCARGHRPAGPYQPIVTTAGLSVYPQRLLVNLSTTSTF